LAECEYRDVYLDFLGKLQVRSRPLRYFALLDDRRKDLRSESGTGPLLAIWGAGKAGQVRYWQYGQAEKSPDLAISDLSRFGPPQAVVRGPRSLESGVSVVMGLSPGRSGS